VWDGKSAIPIVKDKDNILISIVGGAGLHSSWSPSWGGPKHQAVTKLIRMPKPRTNDYDVLVIGQGYAGLTMAKLANEKGLRTANFEGNSTGGLIINLNELEPAPPGDGETGSEIVSNLAMQNMDNGVEVISDAVISVERSDEGKWIVKTETKAYSAPNVVVASGARLRKLGVPGEQELFGNGVHECVHCDGSLFQNMETVLVGGGDSAFQEAIALAHYAAKVTMIMRGDAPRARADLRQHVDAAKNIVQLTGTRVLAINGTAGKKVESVRIVGPKGESDLPCAGVFTFIGLEPNSEFLPEDVKRDATGAVIAGPDGRTSLPGLWAIGAVRSGFPGLLKDASDEAARVLAAIGAEVGA
jgi:thioredoxin reductase (NADPH)